MSPGASDSGSAVAEILEVLEDLGIPYHVGGSYASSFHGVPRFVKGGEEFDELELRRSVEAELPQVGDRRVPIKSAEDTLLRKLQWFLEGGRVSDRQWTDVLGILKVQGDRLDRAYVEEWAERLGVGDLLREARRAAGSS